jgi:hypothetical protein
MLTHLRRCQDVGLGLDGPRPQQSFPVGRASWDCEGGRIGDDLGFLSFEGQRDFREAELEVFIRYLVLVSS